MYYVALWSSFDGSCKTLATEYDNANDAIRVAKCAETYVKRALVYIGGRCVYDSQGKLGEND